MIFSRTLIVDLNHKVTTLIMLEIEQKFVVTDEEAFWKEAPLYATHAEDIMQVYLPSRKEDTTERIRIAVLADVEYSGSKVDPGRAWYTIKGPSSLNGLVREEQEHEISVIEAMELITEATHRLPKDSKLPLIRKRRWHLSTQMPGIWTLDELFVPARGLFLLEVEHQSATDVIQCPPWADREVTNDRRYNNSNIAVGSLKVDANDSQV